MRETLRKALATYRHRRLKGDSVREAIEFPIRVILGRHR